MDTINATQPQISRIRLLVLTLAGLAVLALIAVVSYAPWSDDTVRELRATGAIVATIAAWLVL